MQYFHLYFISVIKNKYFEFNGRARREEFWYFALYWCGIIFGLGLMAQLGQIIHVEFITQIVLGISGVFILGTLLPYLGLVARRLHDTGISGLWWLLRLIPLGLVVLVIFYCLDSNRDSNKWGRSPKYDYDHDEDSNLYEAHLVEED